MQSVYLFDPSSHLDQIKLNPTIGAALLDYHFLAISCFSPLHCYNCEDEEREREREREREYLCLIYVIAPFSVSIWRIFFHFQFCSKKDLLHDILCIQLHFLDFYFIGCFLLELLGFDCNNTT